MSDWCSATSKAAIHLEREAIDRDWSRLVKVCHDWSSLFSTSHDRSLLVMIGKNFNSAYLTKSSLLEKDITLPKRGCSFVRT